MYESIEMTSKARSCVDYATTIAKIWEDSEVSTQHLLFMIVMTPSDVGARMLKDCGITHLDPLLTLNGHELSELVDLAFLQPTPDASFDKVMQLARDEAMFHSGSEHGKVGTEHLLIALALEPNGLASSFMLENGVDYVKLRRSLQGLRQQDLSRV